VFSQSRAP